MARTTTTDHDGMAARGALVAARYVSPQATAVATPSEVVALLGDLLAYLRQEHGRNPAEYVARAIADEEAAHNVAVIAALKTDAGIA